MNLSNKSIFSIIRIYITVIIILLFFTSCFTDVDEIILENENLNIVLELNISKENPRNSEGDFIKLKNGRILFVYSHFVETISVNDSSPSFLASRYSDDGGVSWSKNDVVIVEFEDNQNVMCVNLLRLQNGNIALFYLRKKSHVDCIPMMRISKDEGKSWSNEVPCIIDRQGYFVLNNDRVTQLNNGRILMPVSLHRTPDRKHSDVGEIYCYYSDDNGLTWKSSSKVPNKNEIVIQEPGLIEMKNGAIMMFMRATGGYQQISYSFDNGQNWSNIETSNITSPLSPASIKKIPKSNNWLLVWNNTKGSSENPYSNRSPLTVAISKDEGTTWISIKNIADKPFGSFCYASIHFVDDDYMLIGFLSGLNTVIIRVKKSFFEDYK